MYIHDGEEEVVVSAWVTRAGVPCIITASIDPPTHFENYTLRDLLRDDDTNYVYLHYLPPVGTVARQLGAEKMGDFFSNGGVRVTEDVKGSPKIAPDGPTGGGLRFISGGQERYKEVLYNYNKFRRRKPAPEFLTDNRLGNEPWVMVALWEKVGKLMPPSLLRLHREAEYNAQLLTLWTPY